MTEKRLLSQINVTPFVDVMLVLLIIFMVTAPMMQEGIDVNLPKVEASGLEKTTEPIVITINRKGHIYINDKKFGASEFRKKIKAIAKRKQGEMVLLKADKAVPYGSVISAMASIRRAGIERIGMITEPVTQKR